MYKTGQFLKVPALPTIFESAASTQPLVGMHFRYEKHKKAGRTRERL
jgi:hypothetical protein